MAYELRSAADLDELARQAADISAALRKAARIAERLPEKALNCEIGNIALRLPPLVDQAERLGLLVKKTEKQLEKEMAQAAEAAATEKQAAADVHATAKEKAKRRGA
jgi:hypothetical protein